MKKKILLIDDEEILVKRVSKIIGNENNEVFTAYNGEDGLRLILSSKWDLIICDINMPKKNGIDVLKEARSLGSRDKFIFFTGHGNEELMLESLKYGANGFVDKPNFTNLRKAINDNL